jgi:hypothetical protein
MAIERVTWAIMSEGPLIQSNPQEMWATPEKPDPKVKKARTKTLRGTDKECFLQAKKQLYVNNDGLHYHPANAFWKSLLMACDGRVLGKTAALTVLTQAVALIDSEFILMQRDTVTDPDPQPMKGDEWQIDFRRAVCHQKDKMEGGVGIVAIRPKWKVWGGLLTLEVDTVFFKSFEGLTELINIAGHNYGAGVGRMRVKAHRHQKPIWSGFGAGKYSAVLVSQHDL